MKTQATKSGPSGRIKSTCALMALAGVLALPAATALADSKDGTFPTADQVGGQVYVEPVGVGKKLPLDFEAYDMNGEQIDLAKAIDGKRSMVVFFISAVPVSVEELVKIENFARKHGKGINLVFVNADTVGSALQGGPKMAVPNTVKTMHVIKKEQKLQTQQMYVAPNDALSPSGVSNRLGFRGLPTAFVVGKNGVIEKVFVGPQNWKSGDI
ncbi:MAG: redoxin family protein [Thiobacillus sp.]|nr:redoxin family protein [Thiobacillus sp.]